MLQREIPATDTSRWLPVGSPCREGQLWVIARPSQKMLSRQAARKRMLAEDIVLDQLKSPLLFLAMTLG